MPVFDVGFLELVVVLVVALLVIGPEHIPDVVRNFLTAKRRILQVFDETRREVETRIGAADIKRQIHNEDVMRSLGESREAIDKVRKELP